MGKKRSSRDGQSSIVTAGGPSSEEPGERFASFVGDVEPREDGAALWIDGADELEVIDHLAPTVVAVVVAAATAAGIDDALITHPRWRRPKRPPEPPAVTIDDWPSREDLFLPMPPEGGTDSSGDYGNDGRRFGCGHPSATFREVLDYYMTALPQEGWEITFAVRTWRSGSTNNGGFLLGRRGDLRLLLSGGDRAPRHPVHWTIEVRQADGDAAYWETHAQEIQEIRVHRLVDKLSQGDL
jgi:hypothetical protein